MVVGVSTILAAKGIGATLAAFSIAYGGERMANVIPEKYTTSDWAEGEFRMGFTISRLFNI